MRDNTIRATFSEGSTYTRTDPVFQYDRGLKLIFEGTEIEQSCIVHFASSPSDDGSYTSIAEWDGETLKADIPDNLLEETAGFFAYLYYTYDDNSSYTVYRVYTPVIQRAKPDGYTPTESEASVFEAALRAVEEASASIERAEQDIESCVLTASLTPTTGGYILTVTDKNGEHTATILNGQKGDKGEKGERGEEGERGEKGETGAQGPQGEQGIQGIQGEQGPAGNDGSDGFSPTASVVQTATGATITITDENGTTTAVISNGQDGRDGQDGEDYVLTAQDKSDIADIVISEIGSADTTAY